MASAYCGCQLAYTHTLFLNLEALELPQMACHRTFSGSFPKQSVGGSETSLRRAHRNKRSERFPLLELESGPKPTPTDF